MSTECKVCKGKGEYEQTYTAGCGFGSYQSVGRCDYCGGTGKRKELRASTAAAVPEGAWHEAALAECMKIEAAYHPTDPARTLKELIDWHVQEASGVAQGVKIMADNYVRLTCATSTVPEGALPPLRMTEQEAFALAIQSGRADKFIFRIPGTMKSHKVECAVLEPADALKFARAAVEADRAQRPENANQPLCDSALRAEPAGTGFLTIGWREALEKLRPDTTTHTHDTEIADAVLDEVIDALDDLEESQRCAAPHEQGNLGEMFIVAGGKWDGVRWVVENSDLATFMRSVLAAGAARQGGDGAPEAVSADRAQQGEPVDEHAAFLTWWDSWVDINTGCVEYGIKRDAAISAWKARAATKAAAPADAPVECKECTSSDVVLKNSGNVNINGAAPVPDTGIPNAGEVRLTDGELENMWHEACLMHLDMDDSAIPTFARALEAEVASRCRAQGGGDKGAVSDLASPSPHPVSIGAGDALDEAHELIAAQRRALNPDTDPGPYFALAMAMGHIRNVKKKRAAHPSAEGGAAEAKDDELRQTAGYRLGWMEGMQEGAELAMGGEKTAADVEAEFADLLPGSYYMDPPDGGSPSVLEQVSRMAEDAAKYRESRASAKSAQWSHDLQQRLMAACQDVAESDDARQLLAEAACALAELTSHAATPSTQQEKSNGA